jgi:hypothetical protein
MYRHFTKAPSAGFTSCNGAYRKTRGISVLCSPEAILGELADHRDNASGKDPKRAL